jgi:predicted AAA+ superfamily ATPase
LDIYRNNYGHLISQLIGPNNHGIILPGIVGCGKTHLLGTISRAMAEKYGFRLFQYEGDDSKFRAQVRSSSSWILNEVQEAGADRAFVFVDEVQKEPEIFDAIKLAYDKAKVRFAVSGSNPAFLRTTANDRLQRRALVIPQFPLSIQEILTHHKLCTNEGLTHFGNLIENPIDLEEYKPWRPTVVAEIRDIVRRYLVVGGLPQAWLANDLRSSLTAVKLVAERGITDTYQTTVAADDETRQFLADRNSQEFTYKGLQQTLRSSKRNTVDRVIDHLMNHGYLFKKTPFLGNFTTTHSTYFATYSWVDPGLVSYFTNPNPTDQELGFRLESYVHTRLIDCLARIPIKSGIYYYKPFSIKPSNDALSFGAGEIDFVIKIGREVIPIEVKLTPRHKEIDTQLLEEFIAKYKSKFGIVLYGGSTIVDQAKKIIYFPYWAI